MGTIKKTILLLLKTPPPYGGGEIRGEALRDYVDGNKGFVILEMGSAKRNKSSQGVFAIWKLLEFLTYWIRFIAVINKHRPQLVFFSASKEFVPFLRDSVFFWTARLFKISFSCELAGSSFYFLGKGRLKTWYGRKVLSRFKVIRVLGVNIAQELSKFGIHNTIVTDNGIKCDYIDDVKCLKQDNCIDLIFAGTHSQQKGFDQLVESCVFLHQENLKFNVHCMGEWVSDQFRENMSKIIKDNDLNGNFIFHGLTHGKRKWELLNKGDILVLPSLREGQPLVILEALACGMAVVATRVGAIPDTIQDNVNGFLTNPGDSSQLTDRIKELILDQGLLKKIAIVNRSLYEKRFTQKKYLQTQVAFLHNIADGSLIPRGQYFSIR